MTGRVRYFVQRDSGEIVALVRIHQTDTELWGEYLLQGQWIEDAAVMDYLADPLCGDEISETEAANAARALGGRL